MSLNKRFRLLLLVLFVTSLGGAAWSFYREATAGDAMVDSASAFLKQLDDAQTKSAVIPFDDERRVGWHFIPMKERKGLQVKHMDEEQRKAAHALLASALSEAGYKKATTIMSLEKLLHELEGDKRNWARDHEMYYFTIFGNPGGEGKWGLSAEGHHLSLNFVVENGKMISSTPQFFASNPAVIMNENSLGFEKGFAVLKGEEEYGFELVKSLSDEQRKVAMIAEEAPAEIRAAGEAQPPTDAAVGIAASELNEAQKKTLYSLIDIYAQAMPKVTADERWIAIKSAGLDKIHFAWAGATKRGIGHYYRIQGPTFLVEFVNTQPDAAGNPVNHIHCVWRDMNGDFALPIGKTE